jgi:hypothetical protein
VLARETCHDTGFRSTRWSAATHATALRDTGGAEALAELFMRYRYPVYAYVRRSGHAPAAALELMHRFLDALQRRVGADPPTGRPQFRRFLLDALATYVASHTHSAGAAPDAEPDSSAPLEARFACDAARDDAPAQAFQRGFAVDVLLRAFARLREEAEATGHGAMYAALAPYFARDPEMQEYDLLAASLRMRPLTIAVALQRLRQRLQELAAEELADTVSTAAELADEQAAMLAALGENGGNA